MMKRNMMIFMALAFCVGCSGDFLDTKPTDSVSSATIFENTDNVGLAVNGMMRIMQSNYGGNWSGEGGVDRYMGNYPSNTYTRAAFTSYGPCINRTNYLNANSSYTKFYLAYYYRIINIANTILFNIDGTPGNEAVREHYKAQALVMRSYAYLRLSCEFFRRWGDGMTDEAKNGNGLMLRLTPSTSNVGYSSMKQIFEQIYSDLGQAIPILEKKAVARDPITQNYQIDADVAYAIFARAALEREDYATARDYARKAYKDHPLMTWAEYVSGFNTPNSEWIWSTYCDQTLTHANTWFADMAYNSGQASQRSYIGCVDKKFFNSIPDTDLRKTLFLDPKSYAFDPETGRAKKDQYPELDAYARSIRSDIPDATIVAAWMSFKFKSTDNAYDGDMCISRASEMYLIYAEASYRLDDEISARAALTKLVKDTGRNPSFDAETLSGAALLNEIKFQRNIELWGEGFNGFDLKRWGDPMDRVGFADGGNWYSGNAIHSKPDESNNYWTSVMSVKETDYNTEL